MLILYPSIVDSATPPIDFESRHVESDFELTRPWRIGAHVQPQRRACPHDGGTGFSAGKKAALLARMWLALKMDEWPYETARAGAADHLEVSTPFVWGKRET